MVLKIVYYITSGVSSILRASKKVAYERSKYYSYMSVIIALQLELLA